MAKKLKLKIHNQYNTTLKRLRFVELAREKVRREHNKMGDRFRGGAITKSEWEEYKTETFGPRNMAVTESLLAIRAEVKDEVRLLPDNDKDMVDIDPAEVFEEEQ